MDDLGRLLSGADEARPLTDELRSKLSETLLGRTAALGPGFRGIDAARPLPPRLQAKLRRTLERRRVAAWQVASAVTAAAAVLIGIVVLPGSVRRPAERPAALRPTQFPNPTPGGVPAAVPGAVVGLPGAGAGPSSAPAASDAYGDSYRGSPPPFGAVTRGVASPLSARASGSGGAPAMQPPPPPPPPPVPARIAVTGADPDVMAGFNAYVALVRAQRDVGNRTFEIVGASARDALVSVNLGSSPVDAAGSVPVLETLDVDAATLTGNVFDIASTPRRQARVLADQIIATTDLESDATPTAVIYRTATGEFAQTIPAEVASILQDAGVVVFTMDYRPGSTTFVPTDIAFVSMPPGEARSFVREAVAAGYAPRLGLAGVWSLYDDAVRAELGSSKATVLSPYWSFGNEYSAIKRGVEARGARMGAEAIHGWAAAKAIAVALYEVNPHSPREMATALGRAMTLGVCPYRLRPGTHERTPDGVILEMTRDGIRIVSGEYLTDPR